ncbi:hypothetical protein, partial [Cupriavidus sp. UBA2010]|uniref:hypothetical protein n=1 Tax=Cupriavidus sp. UBA2010 TaxID=1946396 RepID=UPI00257B53DA
MPDSPGRFVGVRDSVGAVVDGLCPARQHNRTMLTIQRKKHHTPLQRGSSFYRHCRLSSCPAAAGGHWTKAVLRTLRRPKKEGSTRNEGEKKEKVIKNKKKKNIIFIYLLV